MGELCDLLELLEVREDDGGDGGGGHLGHQTPVEVEPRHVDNIVCQLVLVNLQKVSFPILRNILCQ